MEVATKTLSDPNTLNFWKSVDQTLLTVIHSDDVDLNKIIYPPNLTNLIFKYKTETETSQQIIFPNTIKILEIQTNSSFDLFVFPKHLKKLVIKIMDKQSLIGVKFPSQLESLELSEKFSEDLSQLDLPECLQRLTLGHRFNFPIDLSRFQNLTHLRFGHRFNRDLVNLPKSLEFIQVGEQYNKNIEKTDAVITYGYKYEQYDKVSIQKEFVKNLPHSIKGSLKWYTGPGEELNILLRNKERFGNFFQKQFDNISKAFNNVPKLEEPITVYRGMKESPNFNSKSFISTSVSREVAIDYTSDVCCLLEILVTPGSKVLPLVSISLYPEQEEILLFGSLTFVEEKIENGMRIFKCAYSGKKLLKTSIDKTLTTVHSETPCS